MGLSTSTQVTKHDQKFKSEQLQSLAEQFCLESKQIHDLYNCFLSFQTKTEAYLTLDDLAETLHYGNLHFSEMPYLERLFSIISRKAAGKLFFEEYVAGVSTFCLMSSESILHFVFDWLDKDVDGQIDRADIARAVDYTNPKTGEKTFLSNFMSQVDRNLKHSQQQLQFEEFRQLSNKLLFLIWPAYQLQNTLRQRNMGSEFWEKQYLKIEKSEQLQRKNENRSVRMMEKVLMLSRINKTHPAEQPTLRQQMVSRESQKCSTDIQLLKVKVPQRRRSCPYLKPILIKEMHAVNELKLQEPSELIFE